MHAKLLSLFFIFLFCPFDSDSQVTFEKNYYKDSYTGYLGQNNNASPAIITTKDSGYLMVSYNGDSIVPNSVISLTRMDKQGQVLWNKMSDPYILWQNEGLQNLVQYPDSSLVMLWDDQTLGYPYARGGFAHVDKNGNAIWARKYTCPANRVDMFMDYVTRTYDNGLIAQGRFSAYPSGIIFNFLLKTDSAGNIQWCKQYFPDSSLGYSTTAATRIALAPDSGFFLSFCEIDSFTDTGYGCLMKTDANGNVQWVKRYNPQICLPVFTRPQIYNNTIILPLIYNSFNNIAVLKTNMQGVPVSNSAYIGPDIFYTYDGETDDKGNTFLSGITINDTLGFILKIDSSGNVLWSHEYGKPDSMRLSNLLFTLDGGLLGYGWQPTYPTISNPQYLINIVKTNASGEDGCEQPFEIDRRAVPLVWKNISMETYTVLMTQKDTILHFSSAPIESITECTVKPIVKPLAKIYIQKDTLCNGYCLCFNDSSLNGPSAWKWYFTGASQDSSYTENPCNICYAVSGKYLVTLIATNYKGSDTTHDSVIVISQPVVHITGKDTICQGDSAKLVAVPIGLSYLWSTGNRKDSIIVAPITNTYYYVTASNGYCSVKDSMDVVVSILTTNACCDTTIPLGDTIQLAASGGNTYQWNPQGIGCYTCPDIDVSPEQTTTYYVNITNKTGCHTRDSIVVKLVCPVAKVCCAISIMQGDSVQLQAGGGSAYLWSPPGKGCDTCSIIDIQPMQTTTYTVIVKDGATCMSEDSVTVTVLNDKNCGQIFIPDVFAPNEALHNNILYVRGSCIAAMDFIVFDRWGNKVFESQNQNIGWDGTWNGTPMDMGTYIWVLKATLQDRTSVEKKGNVTIVR